MPDRLRVGRCAARASLALLLCSSALAYADRVTIDAVSRPAVDKQVLRLVVRPGSALPTDRPLTARLGEGGPVVELRDDGQMLDLVAGDGAWVGATQSAPEGGDTDVVVLDADGAELMRAVVPVDPTLGGAWLSLAWEDGRVGVSLGGGSTRDPAAEAPGAFGAKSETSAAPQAPDDVPPPLEVEKDGVSLWVLVVGLAGLAGGWLMRGQRRSSFPPPVAPGAAPIPGLHRIAPADLADTVADRAVRGAVLLLPSAAHRLEWEALGQGRPLVRWLHDKRPTARRVRQARALLATTGPVTLIVDGVEALEPADPDEASDAVVQELVEDSGAEVVLVQPPTHGGEST